MTSLLRAPEPSDLDTLYLWENDEQLWRVSLNQGPVSRHALWQYLQEYSPDIALHSQLRLIITTADGSAAGTVDLTDYSPRHRRAEVGIFIAPQYRRNGLARKAIAEIADYAHNTIGLHQLTALVGCDNEPAIKLFEEAGFKICGRLRSYLRLRGDSYSDVFIMQRIL